MTDTTDTSAEAEDEDDSFLRQQIDSWVLAGFLEYDDALDAIEDLVDDDEPLTIEQARAYLDLRWDARIAEQQQWPATTDSDRLESAFADLEAAGLAARMNFSCCGTCAPGDIADDVAGDPSRRGYVYFHEQDGERISDGEVYLGYGSLEDFRVRRGWRRVASWDDDAYAEAAVAIGREVADTLRRHRFTVEWNGSLDSRIAVVDLTWRRRLPPRAGAQDRS